MIDRLLFVGLRNPGSEYDGTRHNVGARVVTTVAEDSKFKRAPKRIRARVAQISLSDKPVTVALPTTFMNEVGGPVSGLVDYYSFDLEDMVVVHDDIDLPFGRLRLHLDRGPGGHNGVASITKSLGSRRFWRLKFGVGRPPGRMDPADYVLRRFSTGEESDVDLLVAEAADVLSVFAGDGPDAARQQAGEAAKRLGMEE